MSTNKPLSDDERYYRMVDNAMKNHEAEYRQSIEAWDWSGLHNEALGYPAEVLSGDTSTCSIYIGTVFGIMPSGKYYTPWANSNVSQKEAAHDEVFSEILNEIRQEKGAWLDSGEGDPCDLYLCWTLEEDDDKENKDEHNS